MGRISRRRPGAIRADVLGHKLRAGPWNLGKTNIWLRTSTRRRPWHQGVQKGFGQKNFGLIFRPLHLGSPWRSTVPKLPKTPKSLKKVSREEFPALPFLVFFFRKRQGKPPKKQGLFYPHRTPRENAQKKQGIPLRGRKGSTGFWTPRARTPKMFQKRSEKARK